MEKSRYKHETVKNLSRRKLLWIQDLIYALIDGSGIVHKTNATDESIKSYEYNEYQPIIGTQLNSAGQITITIENQDQFLHLHNSYLLIEGEVLKSDDARYADADLITPIMDCCIYFPVWSTLAGQEMKHVNYLGHAT